MGARTYAKVGNVSTVSRLSNPDVNSASEGLLACLPSEGADAIRNRRVS